MQGIQQTLAAIGGADKEAMEAVRVRWNSLAKPVGGLGMLEDLVVRLAGIQGTSDVRIPRRELIVTCSDNGVVRQGVSASDAAVTRIMARAIGAGQSTVCVMARHANCTVIPIDLGMLAGPAMPGVQTRIVRLGGTDDISCGPAMTREECERAIGLGIDLVRERKEAGASVLLLGEMGIGNTTTSTAVTCALYGEKPSAFVGPGTGLSAEGVAHKCAVIESALAVNAPDADDPVDILTKVGGLDIAVFCGICLGGARHRLPILLDGIITLAGAACAVRLCPNSQFVLLASHVSAEPVAQLLLGELDLEAALHAQMHLGEGTGAVAMLSVLDLALSAYHEGSTLDELDICGYKPTA